MDTDMHIVEFDKWCPSCKHESKDESEYPCWECLEEPVNENSRKPVFYREANK